MNSRIPVIYEYAKVFLLAGVLSTGAGAEDYFPLRVGNWWLYFVGITDAETRQMDTTY